MSIGRPQARSVSSDVIPDTGETVEQLAGLEWFKEPDRIQSFRSYKLLDVQKPES